MSDLLAAAKAEAEKRDPDIHGEDTPWPIIETGSMGRLMLEA